MVAQVRSITYLGIDAIEIKVEAHIAPGLPNFIIVGLPDKAVGESRERVRAAFSSVGLSLPARKVIINMAPADIQKEGSHFDLAIAASIMVEVGVIQPFDIANYVILGELSLDGSLNAANGTLPAAIVAQQKGLGIIIPAHNYEEAYWSGNKNIIAINHLKDMVRFFNDDAAQPPPTPTLERTEVGKHKYDLADVKGQKVAKRALEIAATGGHNLLMVGPPGSGKSMLAKRLPSIMPPLSPEEVLDISSIYSVAGQKIEGGIVTTRPFRDPHSSSSMAAMVGGGRYAKPGEVTLAHKGILFLDELPEYSKNVLESLRQPTEDGTVTIARVNCHVTYPAQFQLVAAMNPCKCGYFGDDNLQCNRAPICSQDYQSKISGPLMDRFDLRIFVPTLNPFLQETTDVSEDSNTVLTRVIEGRERQALRNGVCAKGQMKVNAKLESKELDQYVQLDTLSLELLKSATVKFRLSMRGINRILKVARTIADLAGSEGVVYEHLLEAISYRMMG